MKKRSRDDNGFLGGMARLVVSVMLALVLVIAVVVYVLARRFYGV